MSFARNRGSSKYEGNSHYLKSLLLRYVKSCVIIV
eukprot:UN22198